MRLPLRLLCLLTLGLLSVACFAEDQPPGTANGWNVVAARFRPVNVTAQGSTIWVCGADEMILSSKDGGATWETRHQNPDGEVLLDISFVDEKVGHAAGTGGLLLSTDDGGQTWKGHVTPGIMRAFSFADAVTGIAVIDAGNDSPQISSSDQAVPIHGTVKITHDGGERWEDIAALDSEELRPFLQTLSIAALDSSHFLMLRRQPEVEDIFIVTKDGGKSWKVVHPQNDATNRALPRMAFVHQGEYWAFGHELVHREKGGGYGVPLTLHSKDGETWTHGVAGPTELDSCTSQGCYLWDGAVEILFAEHEQFWSLPQDGSLGPKWAIAGSTACSVNGTLKCGRATATDKPLDRPEALGGVIFLSAHNNAIADDCLDCHVDEITPDKAGPPSMQQVHAMITVRRDGTVANVSVNFPPSKRISDEISSQLSKWLFEPAHQSAKTVEVKKEVSLVLMCAGFPDRPETNHCTLHGAGEFSRFRRQ